MFDNFFSGIKINNAKCGITGIGAKKGFKMTLCGMECIYLTDDVIKTSGIYFLTIEKLKQEKNIPNHKLRN